MIAQANAKNHFIPNFEMHSVLLLAAFVIALSMSSVANLQESATQGAFALQPGALLTAAGAAPTSSSTTANFPP